MILTANNEWLQQKKKLDKVIKKSKNKCGFLFFFLLPGQNNVALKISKVSLWSNKNGLFFVSLAPSDCIFSAY